MLKQQLQLRSSKPHQDVKLIQFFNAYRVIQSPHPILLLRQLAKILPPHAVATDLGWIAQDTKQTNSILTLNLVVNKKALSQQYSYPSGQNSFFIYKKKIQQDLQKLDPNYQVSFGDLSSQNGCSLKITSPSGN